jgi:hypothetical protein
MRSNTRRRNRSGARFRNGDRRNFVKASARIRWCRRSDRDAPGFPRAALARGRSLSGWSKPPQPGPGSASSRLGGRPAPWRRAQARGQCARPEGTRLPAARLCRSERPDDGAGRAARRFFAPSWRRALRTRRGARLVDAGRRNCRYGCGVRAAQIMAAHPTIRARSTRLRRHSTHLWDLARGAAQLDFSSFDPDERLRTASPRPRPASRPLPGNSSCYCAT